MPRHLAILLLISLTLLAACSDNSSEKGFDELSLQGRILLWHDWSESDTIGLNELLDSFTVLHPDVQIIRAVFPPEELKEAFISSTSSALGPDLLIGQASWARQLADEGLIQEINPDEVDSSAYLSIANETLRDQDKMYGLPFSLSTNALCYNKNQVESPPATLNDLLQQAANGKSVALNTNFEDAFWGIQAFGGQLFDEQGAVALNQGGFANWLGWLKRAKYVPNVTLSNNPETLFKLFTEGEVAYYVCHSFDLPKLQEALGEEVVGVAPLPTGPLQEAGPFVETEALLLSRASNSAETRIALELAKFLMNGEQQTSLALKTGKLPANTQARIDERISPIAAVFAKQSKTAVPVTLSQLPLVDKITKMGNEIYVGVLEGVLNVNEAAELLKEELNDEAVALAAQDEVMSESNPACQQEARLEVWHAWNDAEEKSLNEIRRRFMQDCGKIIVTLKKIEPDELYDRYQEQVRQGYGPDLVILSTELFDLMLRAGVLRDITDMVQPSFLQQYVPVALSAIRHEKHLYGLPLAVQPMALYYNSTMVTDPPMILDDLLAQASSERQVALPISFKSAYWGVPAFGGQLFSPSNHVILNQAEPDEESAFARWLNWLTDAQAHSGIVLSNDYNELTELFLTQKAAYLVGDTSLLNQSLTELEGEREQVVSGESAENESQQSVTRDWIRAVPLPAGPQGPAGPFLTVEALILNPEISQQQATAALEFAKYMTNLESQAQLTKESRRVSANVKLEHTKNEMIAGFLEQAQTATVQPSAKEIDAVLRWGDMVYEDVLKSKLSPTIVVNHFTEFMNHINGFEVAKKEFSCDGEGDVLLWHSWPEKKAEVLSQLITEFSELCVTIKIKSRFVAAKRLPKEFSTALEEGQPPDFFLASHDLIRPFSEQEMIKLMTPFVDDALLVNYMSKSNQAFNYNDAVYGLPLAFDTVALYHRRDDLRAPLGTVEELLEGERSLGLESDFFGASWGISAFGGELFNEEGELTEDTSGFEAWLQWLQRANKQEALILSRDQAELEELFIKGEVSYLVAGSDALTVLEEALGSEKIAVSPLPDGPKGSAHPLLRVEGFLFSNGVSDQQTQLALSFAKYATSEAPQTLLRKKANLIPTNKFSIEKNQDQINAFETEAASGLLLPHHADLSYLLSLGDELYQNVLENELDPAEALKEFKKSVNSHQ